MQNPDPDKLNAVLLLQGNIWQQVLSFHFVLEILNTVPFTVTVSTNKDFSSFKKLVVDKTPIHVIMVN